MNQDIKSCGDHSEKCLPLSDLAVDVYRFKYKVKERVRKVALASASAIFSEERTSLITKSQSSTSELAKYLPQFRNMRSTLARKKLKGRPKLTDSLRSIKIDGK